MSHDYDSEYVFLHKPDCDSVPFLMPDACTEDRDFRFARQDPGSAPLVFLNAWAEENREQGIVSVVPDVLFDGTDILLNTDLHAKLTALDLPGVCTHPAIYIGDDGVRHEGYWYLTFPERFDCWDREASDVEQDDPPLQLGDVTLHQVYGYRLNATLLDATPLRERLLFKMGGTLDAFVVCHASLRSLFEGAHAGVELQAVADY